MFTPDPVSLWFERAAANALELAYSHPGRWYGTIIANPTDRHIAAAAGLVRVPLTAPDPHPGRKAKTRWCRAFVRALERQAKGGPKIEWNVGTAFSNGRAFRVRTVPAGTLRKPLAKPDRQRIWTPDGEPGGRFAWPDLRDWDNNAA